MEKNGDEDADEDLMMTMSILKQIEKEEENVLNFKGSIPDRIVIAWDSIKDHRDLYADYF